MAPGPVEQMADVAAAALAGAEQGLREGVSFDVGVKPIVVVTVAWSYDGGDFACASAIPDNHGNALLADSLRASAEDAEEAHG